MPVNYQNSRLYAIRSYCTEEIYIGSTAQPLSRRMADHRSLFKRYNEGKTIKYLTAFEILKYDDVYIEQLELFPCANVEELRKREGELIRSMDCVNKCIAGRTPKQHYQDNKESILARQKQYNDEHKVEKQQYDKQYHQDHKVEKKKYYQANKASINAKHECPCGGRYTHQNKKQHERSNKHFDYMNLYVV